MNLTSIIKTLRKQDGFNDDSEKNLLEPGAHFFKAVRCFRVLDLTVQTGWLFCLVAILMLFSHCGANQASSPAVVIKKNTRFPSKGNSTVYDVFIRNFTSQDLTFETIQMEEGLPGGGMMVFFHHSLEKWDAKSKKWLVLWERTLDKPERILIKQFIIPVGEEHEMAAYNLPKEFGELKLGDKVRFRVFYLWDNPGKSIVSEPFTIGGRLEENP